MLGLSTDPTFNNEDDDYEEASLLRITENALGQCGVGVQSTLTAADATHMLQVSRHSGSTFVNAKHEPLADSVQKVLHTDMQQHDVFHSSRIVSDAVVIVFITR